MFTCIVVLVAASFRGVEAVSVNSAPAITCPKDMTVIIQSGRRNTAVAWDEPIIFDREEPKLKPVLDALSPRKGSQFYRGPHYIKYRVRDSGGLTDECVFRVMVELPQCLPIQLDHGTSSCRFGASPGQVCKTVCHGGYEVLTRRDITCKQDRTYDGPLPVCTDVQFYRQICDHIAEAPAHDFVRRIDKSLHDFLAYLRNNAYVSSYKSFNFMRNELCVSPKFASAGPCVYLRRFDLFQRVKEDLKHFSINPSGNDDKANNFHQYTYRRVLLTHPEISSFCKKQAFLDELYTYFPDFLRFSNKDYIYTIRNIVSSITEEKTPNLRQEAAKVCTKEYKDPKCLLRDVFGIIDRARKFFHILDTGNNKQEDITWYKYGITFNSVILKWKYGKVVKAIQPFEPSRHMECVTEIIRAIAKYIDEGEDNKIIDLMSLFPEFETDKICHSGTMCLFWRVVDQSHVYVKSRGKKVAGAVDLRIINMQLDKKEFLKQKQMERILQLLSDQSYNLITVAEDLKTEFNNVINKRFSELKTYFKKVHTFSAEVAKADMIVMHQIEGLTKTTKKLAMEIDIKLGILIGLTLTAALGEVVEKSIKLALVTAESCNPLDPSPSNVMDATAELVNAVAAVDKAKYLLTALLQTIMYSRDMKKKFMKNKKFIAAMNNIKDTILAETTNSDNFRKNKDIFLKLYNDYVPAVTKPEVVYLGTYLKNIVSTACDLLSGMDSSFAGQVKSIEGQSGICFESDVLIDKMMSAHEEIYDKQFEFINVILANVRAQVALEATEGILKGYDDLSKETAVTEDVLQTLKQTAGMSYVIYRIMVIQVIRMYCDELEYRNAGVRPDVCRDSRTDISTLLAYKINPCQSRRHLFHTVSEHKRGRSDLAFMNIPALYSGRDITFKIPSNKYLKRFGWISGADMNSVFYVEGFEVYLPTEDVTPRLVRVEVKATGENDLYPGGRRYRLLPDRPMVFEYSVGHGITCRQSQTIRNPFTTCHTNKLPDICQHSDYKCDSSQALHPSLLSSFKVRVQGYEDLLPPNPATRLYVKVALKTCGMPRPDLRQSEVTGRQPVLSRQIPPNSCCSTGTYWVEKNRSCEPCPKDSRTALRGYYCEKIEDTIG